MKLGLIGYPLGHSWSPEIHAFFLNERCYDLYELREEELAPFFASTDLDGFNVTIPYKQEVMRYLDFIDPAAEKIGAVNTIVRKGRQFFGYNTDYEGLVGMISGNGIELKSRHAAILGSGGASKAAEAAVEALGGTYEIVSSSGRSGSISYDDLYQNEKRFQVLINATPVGMAPHEDDVPVELSRFTQLEAVVDIVANPLCTSLVFAAKCMGLKTCGGFEMLVRQALAADKYFTGSEMDEREIIPCMNHLLKERRSIVLTGMPTSGKSTIAKRVSEVTGRPLVEMDALIEARMGMTISEAFAKHGEAYFRAQETALAKELTSGNAVISCGGGIIKNPENMMYLSRNGLVFWIDRDIDSLFTSSSRPLSRSRDDIARLYAERKDLYQRYADVRIDNNGTLEEAVLAVLQASGEK